MRDKVAQEEGGDVVPPRRRTEQMLVSMIVGAFGCRNGEIWVSRVVRSRTERGRWSHFWETAGPKLFPREKLPFELQSTTYSSKQCSAFSLIISGVAPEQGG
jgi:hypothetical protein